MGNAKSKDAKEQQYEDFTPQGTLLSYSRAPGDKPNGPSHRPIPPANPPLLTHRSHRVVNGDVSRASVNLSRTSNDVTAANRSNDVTPANRSNDVTTANRSNDYTNDVTRMSPASRTSQRSSLRTAAGIDESGVFSKTSSASSTSTDERSPTAGHHVTSLDLPQGQRQGPHDRMWSSMSSKHSSLRSQQSPPPPPLIKISSVNGVDKRKPDSALSQTIAPMKKVFGMDFNRDTMTSDDRTATPDTLSLASSLSLSAGGTTVVVPGDIRVDCSGAAAVADAVELQRIQTFYEDKIRRVLERLVEMLANELSPESVDEYLRITRGSHRLARPSSLEEMSAYLDPSAVRELLWNDITGVGLERLDVVCDVVRSNDAEEMQGHLAIIVETVDSLLALVAPVFMLEERTSPVFVGCACASVSPEDVVTFNESRDFDIDIIYCDRETTTLSSDGHRSLLNALGVGSGGGLHHRGSVRRERKQSSTVNSPSISPRVGDNFLFSTHSPGPSLSVRLFHYCLRQDGRTKRLRQLLLESSCRIRELCLVGNHLEVVCRDDVDDDAVMPEADEVSLFDGLKNNCTLVKLDLRLSWLGNSGAELLGAALRLNTYLRVLNVASVGLTDVGCRHLVNGFARHSSLTDLDIGFNDIRDSGCRSVAEALTSPSGCPLRKLRMRDNGITSRGACDLFRSLARNSRLAFLDVSSNVIGDEGAVRLSEALIFNRTLRELNLENCNIFPTGCAALSRALKANTSLRGLQLSRNAIEDSGMTGLADGLKYNGALETLCVNMCCIGNTGFGFLLDALRGNVTLTTVKLCYNLIGGAAGDCFSRRECVNVRGEEFRRPAPTLEELHGRLRTVLHHSPKLRILLWGNSLDAFPAFRAFTDMNGDKVG